MCISADFVAEHGLITQAAAQPVEVILPDGRTELATEEVVVFMRIGAYVNAGWRFSVVTLAAEAYDAVIGMPFLHLHDPVIRWRSGQMILTGRQGKLVLEADPDDDRPEQPSFLMSALQLRRLLKSRAGRDSYAWLVRLRAVDAADTAACEAAATEAAAALAAQLQAEFADILMEKLPPGLPPKRLRHRCRRCADAAFRGWAASSHQLSQQEAHAGSGQL
jgi:hypothetical protein